MMKKEVSAVRIKSTASGTNIVNRHGSIKVEVMDDNGKKKSVDNITFPKAYNLPLGELIERFDLSTLKIYVSDDTIKGQLFKENGFLLDHINGLNKNDDDIIAATMFLIQTTIGLLRGYVQNVKGAAQGHRRSPIQMDNWNMTKGNDTVHLVTRTRRGSKAQKTDGTKSTTWFGSVEAGEVEYENNTIIDIEQLQFIPTNDAEGRVAVPLTDVAQIEECRMGIITAICTMNDALGGVVDNTNINVEHGICERQGSVFTGMLPPREEGFLLNNSAIHVLVMYFVSMLESLQFRQASGSFMVESVEMYYMSTVVRDDNMLTDFDDCQYKEFYKIIT